MKKISALLFLITLSLGMPAHAHIGETLSTKNAKLRIVIDGKEQTVAQEDIEPVTSQMIKIFNSCAISTDSKWLKDLWEKSGMTVTDLWNQEKEKSYFSLSYESPHTVKEMIIPIRNKSLGNVMTQMISGEHKGYIKCQGMELVLLYCMKPIQKYLSQNRKMDSLDKASFNCDAIKSKD